MLWSILLAVLVSGHAADGVTTYRALSQPGFREANPMYGWAPAPHGVMALKGATASASTWAVLKVKEKHPKRAVILAAIVAGVTWTAAIHNSRMLAHGPPR